MMWRATASLGNARNGAAEILYPQPRLRTDRTHSFKPSERGGRGGREGRREAGAQVSILALSSSRSDS